MYTVLTRAIWNIGSKVQPESEHSGHTLINILSPILQSFAIMTNDELKKFPKVHQQLNPTIQLVQ